MTWLESVRLTARGSMWCFASMRSWLAAAADFKRNWQFCQDIV
jgi:hypothetical protein